MSYRASRRILQAVAAAAVLAIGGPGVAAEQPVDDPAQQEQPTQDPNPQQGGLEAQPYEPDRDDGMSWGWLGLLGLAGLLGLRRRERPDVRPRTTTTDRL